MLGFLKSIRNLFPIRVKSIDEFIKLIQEENCSGVNVIWHFPTVCSDGIRPPSFEFIAYGKAQKIIYRINISDSENQQKALVDFNRFKEWHQNRATMVP